MVTNVMARREGRLASQGIAIAFGGAALVPGPFQAIFKAIILANGATIWADQVHSSTGMIKHRDHQA
jgi:hypothetical protein